MDNLLVEQFIEAAQRAASTVHRVRRTPAAVSEMLQALTADVPDILWAAPQALDPSLVRPFLESRSVITVPEASQIATVETGITGAFAGVARTGSVCVANDQSLAGTFSLFTRTHIAVLDERWIVARPRDVFTATEDMPVDFTFITGPSATADMGPLVRGVHGPGTLHIILLNTTG